MEARWALLDFVDIRREIFRRLTISEIWKLTSVSKSTRNQLLEQVKGFNTLDLSHVKWRLKDAHLSSLLNYFPNLEVLNLKGCTKITSYLLINCVLISRQNFSENSITKFKRNRFGRM